VPIGAWLVRNTPEEPSVRPLGADGPGQSAAQQAAARQAGRMSVSEAAQTLPFWVLMSTFFVCGYTSNGMVLTHFMPHAMDHNFTPMQASSALGVMGAMNMIGTIVSGWLCDKFDRGGALATYISYAASRCCSCCTCGIYSHCTCGPQSSA
jgi:predicted MFS family arabinose efflux permease